MISSPPRNTTKVSKHKLWKPSTVTWILLSSKSISMTSFMAYPVHSKVGEAQKCNGTPRTRTQNVIVVGQFMSTTGSQRKRESIQQSRWYNFILRTSTMSSSCWKQNWNFPNPKYTHTILSSAFQISDKHNQKTFHIMMYWVHAPANQKCWHNPRSALSHQTEEHKSS